MATDTPMQLGMVGLGRMGADIVRRLLRGRPSLRRLRRQSGRGRGRRRGRRRRRVVARGVRGQARAAAGGVGDGSRRGDYEHDDRERSPTCSSPGDIVIDGGNTYYHDDIRHAAALQEKGIHYVDVGTSGGVWGLERGFCLMIGGEAEVVTRLEPIFRTIAPGLDAAPSTPGRTGEPTHGRARLPPLRPERRRPLREDGAQRHRVRPDGRLRRGPQHHPQRRRRRGHGPRTPRPRRSSTPTTTATTSTRRGRRGLAPRQRCRLMAPRPHGRGAARVTRPRRVRGHVSDSGEGRWTSLAAIEEGVPAPVLTTALYSRFASRGLDDFANRVLSAMRKQFGGHDEKA